MEVSVAVNEIKSYIDAEIPKELKEPLMLLSVGVKRPIVLVDWTSDGCFTILKEEPKESWFILLPNHQKTKNTEGNLHIQLESQCLSFKDGIGQYAEFEDSNDGILRKQDFVPLRDRDGHSFGQVSINIIQLYFNPFDEQFSIFDRKIFINMLVKYLLSQYNEIKNTVDKKTKRICSLYINFVGSTLVNLKNTLRVKISQEQDELQNHYRALQRLEKSVQDNNTLYRSLSRKNSLLSQELDEVKLYKMFNSLITSGRFEDILFENNKLIAYTGDINIIYNTKNYYIGKFKININLDGTVRMLNLIKRYDNNYDHPHISAEIPCLGTIKEMVPKMIYDGDFLGLLMLLYDFLTSYNREGPYVNIAQGWGNPEDWCERCSYPSNECHCHICSNCGERMENCECSRCPDDNELMENCDCEGCSYFTVEDNETGPHCHY